MISLVKASSAALACAAAAVLVMAVSSSSAVGAQAQTVDAGGVVLLIRWTQAVLRHIPGSDDAETLFVKTLSPADRQQLGSSLSIFLSVLTGEGSMTVRTETRRIAEVGRDVAQNPGAAAFLRRAVILHTDVAVFRTGSVQGVASPAADGLGPQQFRPSRLVVANDGRNAGGLTGDWNWPFARSLVRLFPSRGKEPFVGIWYHASTAFLLGHRLYGEAGPHLTEATLLLPDDGQVTFDRGCVSEVLGLAKSQQLLSDEDAIAARLSRSGPNPKRLLGPRQLPEHGIPPAEIANGDAERDYRRSIQLQPANFEARVRLSRLLILRGRSTEALEQLAPLMGTLSSSGNSDKALSFYAHLFAARAFQMTRAFDAAAHQINQARKLFPNAQSALLADSLLALLQADVHRALQPVEMLSTRALEWDEDPWWYYDLCSGRNWRAALLSLWQGLDKESGSSDK